jgi:MoaA/NifB/PqqE/SkfB family radical SAM enzyme
MPFDGSTIPTDRAIRLLTELGTLNVWSLTLSGGEPFLHPDILAIIETASQSGLTATINTNGLRFLDDDGLIDSLLEMKRRHVQYSLSISLDSPDPIANNRGRGKGQDVIIAAHRAIEAGLDIRIAAVVHAGTLESALDLPSVFPGAKSFSFFPMMATWSTVHRGSKLTVSEDKMKQFWERATRLQEEYGTERITLPFRKRREGEPKAPDSNQETCLCGITKCFIDSQLNVYPCSWTKAPHLCMGSIMNESLESVWASQRAQEIRFTGTTSRLCQATPSLTDRSKVPVRYMASA